MVRLTTIALLIYFQLGIIFIQFSTSPSAPETNTVSTSDPHNTTSQAITVAPPAHKKNISGDIVTDLFVTVDDFTHTMVVNWTNSWIENTVANLTVRYLTYRTFLRDSVLWDNSTLLAAVENKTRHVHHVLTFDISTLSLENKYFTVAIRAEDGNGNSEVSLPYIVYISHIPTTSTLLPTTTTESLVNFSEIFPAENTTAIEQTTTPDKSSVVQTNPFLLTLAFLIALYVARNAL